MFFSDTLDVGILHVLRDQHQAYKYLVERCEKRSEGKEKSEERESTTCCARIVISTVCLLSGSIVSRVPNTPALQTDCLRVLRIEDRDRDGQQVERARAYGPMFSRLYTLGVTYYSQRSQRNQTHEYKYTDADKRAHGLYCYPTRWLAELHGMEHARYCHFAPDNYEVLRGLSIQRIVELREAMWEDHDMSLAQLVAARFVFFPYDFPTQKAVVLTRAILAFKHLLCDGRVVMAMVEVPAGARVFRSSLASAGQLRSDTYRFVEMRDVESNTQVNFARSPVYDVEYERGETYTDKFLSLEDVTTGKGLHFYATRWQAEFFAGRPLFEHWTLYRKLLAETLWTDHDLALHCKFKQI